jgi:outer membrane protein
MMSKFLRITLATVFALSLVAVAQSAPANGGGAPPAAAAPNAPSATPTTPAVATGTRVGTINIEQAIFASNEGRRDFEALNTKLGPKQNELKGKSDELDSLKKQLNSQGEVMNEEKRGELVKQIEAKQKLFDRSMQDAREEAQSQQGEIAQRILGKMAPVIQKYAVENGYGVLLDTSQPWPQGPVIMAGPSVDITQAVVEAYNVQSGVPAPANSGAKPATGLTKPPGSPATKPAAKPATPPASNPPKQ